MNLTDYRSNIRTSPDLDPELIPSPGESAAKLVPETKTGSIHLRINLKYGVERANTAYVIFVPSNWDRKTRTLNYATGTDEFEKKSNWYFSLEQAIEEEVTYEADEGFPVANDVARKLAAQRVREIYDTFGSDTPEPYFDVAPDEGVDIYFDHGSNELQVHIPPPESENHYCFVRLGEERSVHRHPSLIKLAQFLRQVVDEHVVPAE